MKKKVIPVVNVIGIDDTACVIIKHNGGSMGKLELSFPGNNNFLTEAISKHCVVHTLIIGGEKMEIDITLPKDPVWFNSISTPETNSYALQKLSGILSRISVPIINHPDYILSTTRDKLFDLLSDIEGIIVPRCIKIAPNSRDDVERHIREKYFVFPLLVRAALEDGEKSLVKIETSGEIQKLDCFAYDGEKQYYISEFMEYVSSDGYYRKMRFLVIGEKIIPRHLMLSTSWQIHTDCSVEDKVLHTKNLTEEKIFLTKSHTDIVRHCKEIQKRMKLDYFGLDCAIDCEGKLIVFEVNAHTMIGIGKREMYHNDTIQAIKEALQNLIENRA